jgi:glycosyltransferase involved in cell wall biosynthesis
LSPGIASNHRQHDDDARTVNRFLRVGYLSGAPRVSTRNDAAASGPRAHVVSFIKALEVAGFAVHPFIVGDRAPERLRTGTAAETLHKSTVARLLADVTRLILSWLNSRRAWRDLHGRVDWIYERFAVFHALGRRWQRNGIPWILETSGPMFFEAKTQRKSIALGGVARRLEFAAYRQCDVLVCVSESLKHTLIREARVAESKIIVLPNGVDTGFFDPQAHKPHRLFDGLVLGFVGALSEWQGLGLLLDALSAVRVEGLDLSLVIVGDGTERRALEARAASLRLTPHIRFVGRVAWSEVPSYVAGFDIGFSGQVESQMGMYHSPLKLYEYMAMAKPVIASAFADASRVVREGETGFLFEPGSAADLRRALRQAIGSRDDLARMGNEARNLIVAEHTWLSRVTLMLPQIQRILTTRP